MIRIHPYALPLRTPYRWARGVQERRLGLLVHVALPDGSEGWGEAAPPIHEAFDPEALAQEAHGLVDGLDAADPGFLHLLHQRAPHPRLRCGIATAWLSAQAAARGLPLARYLAGDGAAPAEEVPVNGLVTEAMPDAAAARAAALIAAGAGALKVKCTADRAADLARVAAIRAAVPAARLRLDANEAWAPDWSLEHLRAMAPFGIEYVEQPLPRGEPLAALAALRRASPVPVAWDESAQDLDAIQALLDAEAADALILKPQRLGGPDRTLLAARLAASRGVRCTVTTSIETAVGLTAELHVSSLLPQPIPDCGIGTARFLAVDVAEPPALVGGRMRVPDAPGLGVGPVRLP